MGETQYEHFQGFIENMIASMEHFEAKIQEVENYASKYGYTGSGKERVGIRRALEEVEAQDLENEVKENPALSAARDKVVDSPNLLHMGLSKQTLNSLGFALGKDDKIAKNEMNIPKLCVTSPEPKSKPFEPTVTSDEDDDSYPAPILKKKSTKTKPKLNASAFEHSQVEISPGLFVKRPSSKTKGEKELKVVPVEEIQQSPILPKTEASVKNEDKISSIPAISNDQNYGTSPTLPQLETNFLDLQKILINSKVEKKPVDKSSDTIHVKASKSQPKSCESTKTNDDCFDSPELPELKTMNLASYLKASTSKTKVSTKEVKKEVVESSVKDDNFLNAEKDDSDGCGTPELPVLKTVNLANILKMPTYSADNEQNKENKKNDTPELPLLNSQDANLILSSRKTHQSPSKHQPQEDDLGDSPQLPELKTINLAAILREKGTLL